MRSENTYFLDVRRGSRNSVGTLRGSMAYLSSVENRKNLLFIVNFIFLICSLILIGETHP